MGFEWLLEIREHLLGAALKVMRAQRFASYPHCRMNGDVAGTLVRPWKRLQKHGISEKRSQAELRGWKWDTEVGCVEPGLEGNCPYHEVVTTLLKDTDMNSVAGVEGLAALNCAAG